jgi:hypothetical protein
LTQRSCARACSLFAAIIQRLAGLSMGLIEMTLLKFYTYVVESAPHDSWPVFAFSRLANGPLKCDPATAPDSLS